MALRESARQNGQRSDQIRRNGAQREFWWAVISLNMPMYRLSPFIVTYWPEIHSGALVRSEAKVRHAVREVQKRSLKACTAIAFPQFVFAIPLSLICHLFAIWLSFVCQQFVICSYVQYVLFLCQLFIALSFVFDLHCHSFVISVSFLLFLSHSFVIPCLVVSFCL